MVDGMVDEDFLKKLLLFMVVVGTL